MKYKEPESKDLKLIQRLRRLKILDSILKHKVAFSFGLFGVIFLSFLLLTAFIIIVPPQYVDLHVSEEIQEKNNGILDVFMTNISWFGNITVSTILVLASSAAFWLFRYKKEALFMLCTLLSGAIAWILKTLINRPRPTKDLVSVLESTHYQSFPSGHVLFYTAFFGTLAIIITQSKTLNQSLKVSGVAFCMGFIILGAISRVYLGAHWFTDILGGFLVGIMYLLLAGYIYFKNPKKQAL